VIVALSKEGLAICQKLPSARDFRVLLALCGHLSRENRVEVGQSYLAAEMGLTRQSVWLSFQRLQAQNILRKERKHGIDLFYLNEDIGRKVARMVEVPSEEESEEERELNESFRLVAKYSREEERMKAARITGVLSNPFPVEPEETEDLE
jgi:biotin operon repressor